MSVSRERLSGSGGPGATPGASGVLPYRFATYAEF
jgi:hypothetical protein